MSLLRMNLPTKAQLMTMSFFITITVPNNNTLKPANHIFVWGVVDFTGVCIRLIGVNNFCWKSSVDCLKIQKTTNPESYRTFVRYLKDENTEFHTWQLKKLDSQTYSCHYSEPPSNYSDWINKIITQKYLRLFEVRWVTNSHYKLQLSLLFVDLEPTLKSN